MRAATFIYVGTELLILISYEIAFIYRSAIREPCVRVCLVEQFPVSNKIVFCINEELKAEVNFFIVVQIYTELLAALNSVVTIKVLWTPGTAAINVGLIERRVFCPYGIKSRTISL